MHPDESRTVFQALCDVRMSVRYHNLAERLARQVRFFISFLTVVGGSAAAISVLGNQPSAAVALSAITAILGALDLTWGPSEKIAIHRELARVFLDIEASIDRGELTLQEIDAQIAATEKNEPVVNTALVKLAQRQNLIRHGYVEEAEDEQLKLGIAGRIYSLIL